MDNRAEDIFYLSPDREVTNRETANKKPADLSNQYNFSASFSDDSPASGGTNPLDRVIRNSQSSSINRAGSALNIGNHLNSLAHLIANVSEAYSAVVFIADQKKQLLHLGGYHSLSRDFIPDAEIGVGSGLVGWTAENKVRVSVCPFEHDATTLLYYAADQDLKSFIAVPILDASSQLLGVIACDSKKSYAFAKVTEKLLFDCAREAAILIELHQQLNSRVKQAAVNVPLLGQILEQLRACDSESALLSAAAKIPQDLVERDALVIVTTAEGGVGKGTFYTAGREQQIEHRLLSLVCKHKKIICAERSVHALPTDDIKQRSFLSIPFHVMDREAGSFNLLSKPYDAFDATHIAALEEVAAVVGRELERLRLREKFASLDQTVGILPWHHFAIQAKNLIAEAKGQHVSLSLVRIALRNLTQIEQLASVDAAIQSMQRVTRLVDQLKRGPAIASVLYGSEILLLTESKEVEIFIRRLCTMLERVTFSELRAESLVAGHELGELLLQGIQFIITKYPRDGESLDELTSKALRLAASGEAAQENTSYVRHRK